MEIFNNWLKSELKSLKIDVNIYHSYLIGILEDNIDEDEKREMITDIIGGLVENDTELFIKTLFEKWFDCQAPSAQTSKDKPKQEPVDIAKLLETQAKLAVQPTRELSEEQRRIKQQILAGYAQTEAFNEDEDDEQAAAAGDGSDDDPDLEKNTNKADVQKLAREKREQARAESAAKKQKDKEDRAKQKATREEKKANRKAAAVKGERKR